MVFSGQKAIVIWKTEQLFSRFMYISVAMGDPLWLCSGCFSDHFTRELIMTPWEIDGTHVDLVVESATFLNQSLPFLSKLTF